MEVSTQELESTVGNAASELPAKRHSPWLLREGQTL